MDAVPSLSSCQLQSVIAVLVCVVMGAQAGHAATVAICLVLVQHMQEGISTAAMPPWLRARGCTDATCRRCCGRDSCCWLPPSPGCAVLAVQQQQQLLAEGHAEPGLRWRLAYASCTCIAAVCCCNVAVLLLLSSPAHRPKHVRATSIPQSN